MLLWAEEEFTLFLSDAYQRIVGTFTGRSHQAVEQRQEEILPLLSTAADNTGDILAAVRIASSKAFDVMKYDIYNRDVPKTPQEAKDLADKCVNMASTLRKKFMDFILGSVLAITNDVQISRGEKQIGEKSDLQKTRLADSSSPEETTKSASDNLKSTDLSAVTNKNDAKNNNFQENIKSKADWISKVSDDINSVEDGMRKGYQTEAAKQVQKRQKDTNQMFDQIDNFATDKILGLKVTANKEDENKTIKKEVDYQASEFSLGEGQGDNVGVDGESEKIKGEGKFVVQSML